VLVGKKIVLGVCGGIAAYKIIELASRLRKAKADVTVVMTRSATEFVTPLTFREISGNPVITSMWDEPKRWNVEHIALAKQADLFVIAPATANMVGKMANGIADDMLSTTILATQAPLLVVPAMNDQMYLNAVVQQNIQKLGQLGMRVMEPAVGHMACGTEGPGRLPEPSEIFESIKKIFAPQKADLKDQCILITAGGTREPIDPVRYIGNRSSGKMGIALATAARQRGAEVHLVAGSMSVPIPGNIRCTSVETTQEMYDAVLSDFENSTIVIKAAAVADYRVSNSNSQKIKKKDSGLQLNLVENPDILKELGKRKTHQFLVGFAAETEQLIENAQKKIKAKNADLLIANDVSKKESSFNSDTNQIKIVHKSGEVESLPILSKQETAEAILDRIISLRKRG
jgi:phosphopantothenoylcysteine decarboxylase/phosphopantothenate--cysteine ligase, prokaryotic